MQTAHRAYSCSFRIYRLLWYTLVIITAGSPLVCVAQTSNIDGFIESKKNAVISVSNALGRVLEKDAWCSAAEKCSEGQCLLSSCSGILGDNFECNDDVSRKKCGEDEDQEELCEAGYSPKGTLLNMEQPTVRTPEGGLTSNGDNQSMTIIDENVRRDVCALKSISDQIVSIHKENNLTFWLYAGTANKAFIDFPGKPICREDGDEKFSTCGYDPTGRPWYITAASGPRDIVFLFDTTSLNVETSKLRQALFAALDTLDSRDRVAILAFGRDVSILADDNVSLQNGTDNVVDDLRKRLGDLPLKSRFPNVTLALESAFSILKKAEEENISSNCSKYIVVLMGNPDGCFESCRSSAPCPCVQKVTTFLKEKQSSQGPVTVVTFTEPDGDLNEARKGNLDRLAKTMVCSNESSGIWSGGFEDSTGPLLSTFYQITGISLYEEEPKVFSSEIYEDNGGLGEVFTLAVPVYTTTERRLLGVAGVDVTLQEVIDVVGDRTLAEMEIGKLSNESRVCPERRMRSGCALQNLRSQPNSALCAPFYPADSDCFDFGKDRYYRNSTAVTFQVALETCNNLTSGSLATVDTPQKNAFLSGAFDVDGSWIGLKAPFGSNLSWVAGEGELTFDFGFNFDGITEAGIVQDESNTDVCVTADGRGVEKNWNILTCDQMRPFICQMSPDDNSVCTKTVTETSADNINPNPRESCGGSDDGTSNSIVCSAEQDETIKSANPLCNQGGETHSEYDRFCCGGRADTNPRQVAASPSSSPKPTEQNSISGGAVIGIVLAAVVVVALAALMIIVFIRRHKQPSVTGTGSNVTNSVSKANDTSNTVIGGGNIVRRKDELQPPEDGGGIEIDNDRISFDEPLLDAQVAPLGGGNNLPPLHIEERKTESTDWKV